MHRVCLCFALLFVLRSVNVRAEDAANQENTAPDWPAVEEPALNVPGSAGPEAPGPLPPSSGQMPGGLIPGGRPPNGLPSEGSPLQDMFPHFKERAVVLDINARIIDQNQTVTWNEVHRKATFPGRPVGIKLVGANVLVAVQFTPYFRRQGTEKFLVAQGQIWIDIPNQGVRFYTSMQTIPLEFGEPIYFFPLGPIQEDDNACIEVMLTLHPYEEEHN